VGSGGGGGENPEARGKIKVKWVGATYNTSEEIHKFDCYYYSFT
jgi:hypothetical protein